MRSLKIFFKHFNRRLSALYCRPQFLPRTLNTMNTHEYPAALLEKTFGFRLPPAMRLQFESLVAASAKQAGHTLSADELNDFFCKEYIDNTHPFELTTINFEKEFAVGGRRFHYRHHVGRSRQSFKKIRRQTNSWRGGGEGQIKEKAPR